MINSCNFSLKTMKILPFIEKRSYEIKTQNSTELAVNYMIHNLKTNIIILQNCTNKRFVGLF